MVLNKGLLLLSFLLLISFTFQLLAVISVPIVNGITLCTYDNYKFGVFGYCSNSGECTSVGVGYTEMSDLSGFTLPSNARKSISKLLIVHPIAAGFTLILLLNSLVLNIRAAKQSLNYLMIMMLLTLPTFLLTLLSFLVDVLLFIPHLDWYGWVILASTVLIAVSGSILCFVRRTVSSRKITNNEYGQDEQLNNYFNNDNDYTGGFGYRGKDGNKVDETTYGTVSSVVNDDSSIETKSRSPQLNKSLSKRMSRTVTDEDSVYGANVTQDSNLYQFNETIPMTVLNPSRSSITSPSKAQFLSTTGRGSILNRNKGYQQIGTSTPTQAHLRDGYNDRQMRGGDFDVPATNLSAPYPVNERMDDSESAIQMARNNIIQVPKPTLANRSFNSSPYPDNDFVDEYSNYDPPKNPSAPYPSGFGDEDEDEDAFIGSIKIPIVIDDDDDIDSQFDELEKNFLGSKPKTLANISDGESEEESEDDDDEDDYNDFEYTSAFRSAFVSPPGTSIGVSDEESSRLAPPPVPPHLVKSNSDNSLKSSDSFVSVNSKNLKDHAEEIPGDDNNRDSAIYLNMLDSDHDFFQNNMQNIHENDSDEYDEDGTIVIVGKRGTELVAGRHSAVLNDDKDTSISAGSFQRHGPNSLPKDQSHGAVVGLLAPQGNIQKNTRDVSYSTQASSSYTNRIVSDTTDVTHHFTGPSSYQNVSKKPPLQISVPQYNNPNKVNREYEGKIKLEIPPPDSPSTDYSSIANGLPISPTESLGSDFTSVSQRGINPMYSDSYKPNNEMKFIDYQNQPIQNSFPNTQKKSTPILASLQQQLRQPNEPNIRTQAQIQNQMRNQGFQTVAVQSRDYNNVNSSPPRGQQHQHQIYQSNQNVSSPQRSQRSYNTITGSPNSKTTSDMVIESNPDFFVGMKSRKK